MPKASHIQTSFNAGELSPALEGRVDMAKYASGCSHLENFFPLIQGGLRKRSGTRFIKEAKYSTTAVRLIPFEYGTEQAYILEFGHLYMRVHRNGGTVLDDLKSIVLTTAAAPVAVTVTAHGYTTGDEVFIEDTGISSLDSKYWVVTRVDADVFTLDASANPGVTSSGLGTVGKVFEIVTTFASTQIDAIQHAQSADILYLAHPDKNPRKLSRTAHNVWSLVVMVFDYVPFAPTNFNSDIYVTASADSGDGIALTSNAALFTDSMREGQFRLAEIPGSHHGEWVGQSNNDEYTGSATLAGDTAYFQNNVYKLIGKNSHDKSGSSAPIHDIGEDTDGRWDWLFLHSGEGYVTIKTVSSDVTVDGTVYGYRASADVVKTIPKSNVYADVAIEGASGDNPVRINTVGNHGLKDGDAVWIQDVGGMVEINQRAFIVDKHDDDEFDLVDENGTGHTAYSGPSGIVVKLQTHRWSHGAWTGRNGYPRTVTFFEDRLWFAGTTANPQTLWASKTSDYQNHQVVDLDESAMVLTLNTDQVNVIEWINAGSVLAVGTAGGEFIISASSEVDPLVPGNVRAVRHSTYGSREKVAPLRVDQSLLFTQRSGKKLREMLYDDSLNSYVAHDLTVLSDHITNATIKRIVFQQEPNRLIWALLADGTLSCLTYERAQQVSAWHRHVVGGDDSFVESIASIPHPDGDQDQLWMVVLRTIDGAPKRYLEYLEADWSPSDSLSSAFFVDSGISYVGSSTSALAGLDHLEGQMVTVLADGSTHPDVTVTAGVISLIRSATTISVGLPYVAAVRTMRIEAGSADGTAQGKIKRITSVIFRLDQTGSGFKYGPTTNEADMDEMHLRDSYDLMGSAVPLFSGDTESLPWPDGYDQPGRIAVKHALPFPCTITAIMSQLLTQDGG